MTRTPKRLSLGLGASAIALGMAAAVYASTQNTAGGPPPFMGRRPPFARPGGPAGPLGAMRMLVSRLDLTEAQKEQMKGLAQARREEWKALADRGLAARKALSDAVTADAIDEAVIRQRSAEVAAVEADMAVARAQAHAEIFKLLTPEQRAKAKELRSQASARFGKRRQRKN